MINAQSWLHSPLTLGGEETLGFTEPPPWEYSWIFMNIQTPLGRVVAWAYDTESGVLGHEAVCS